MSFVDILCGKKGKGLEREGVQSPLISGTVSEDFTGVPISKKGKASRYLSSDTQKSSINRSAMTSQSMRMSVTDLLEQAEQQTETFSKLFPLIDKEKYKNKSKSESSDSESDMSFEQRHQKNKMKGQSDQQKLDKKSHNADLQMQDSIRNEEGATCSYLQEDDVFPKSDSSLIITKSSELPENADFKRCLSSKRSSSALFGVNIEYLVLDNKLKISVLRAEDEKLEKERKRKFAKLFLMPGNLQCQKVSIATATSTPQNRQSAYFRGINGSELIKMELGVGIYEKQGLLRKDKLILEWFIPIREIDLMEPQTAWRMS